MTSHTTKSFRKLFRHLPPDVQRTAARAYETWCRDPFHPSLDFKQIHGTAPIFAARAGLHWRAVDVRKGDVMIWFWIGSHNDYDNLLKRL